MNKWCIKLAGIAAVASLFVAVLVPALPASAASSQYVPIAAPDDREYNGHLADGDRQVYIKQAAHPDGTYGEGVWYWGGAGAPKLITPTIGAYQLIAIDGYNVLYYNQLNSYNSQVYSYNTLTDQTTTLMFGPGGFKGLSYNNHRLAWYQMRWVIDNIYVSDIWVYDMTADTYSQITHDSWSYVYGSSVNPVLGDNTLYFSRRDYSWDNDHSTLFKFDFATSETTELRQGQFFVDVKTSGDNMAYVMQNKSGPNEIGLYTDALHVIDPGVISTNVQISGDYVAWIQGIGNSWAPRAYQISTNTPITIDDSAQTGPILLTGDQVLYSNTAPVNFKRELYSYALATGTSTKLGTVASPPGNYSGRWTPLSVSGQKNYWEGLCAAGIYTPYEQICVSVPAVAPAVPAGLTAQTPTTIAPVLSWQPEPNATSFEVFRNGQSLGATTSTTYTDAPTLAVGSYDYQVRACYDELCSALSDSFAVQVLDNEPPSISAGAWDANPKLDTATATITYQVSDNRSGLDRAEYYIGGTDPGLGNGTPMNLVDVSPDGLQGKAVAAFGPGSLPAGEYAIHARVRDASGNWSGAPYTSLSVYSLPVFTSAAAVSVNQRDPLEFTVTTDAYPTATITEDGTLPAGVTFVDNGDGTALISGQPLDGVQGDFPVTLTAHNGAGPDAVQQFTLTVTTNLQAPAFVSDNTYKATFGVPFSFTVSTSGYPAASVTKTGVLPAGVTYVNNHDGTATISGAPTRSALGQYPLTLTAHNSQATITQDFTLVVVKAPVFVKTPAKKAGLVNQPFSLAVQSRGYLIPVLSADPLPDGLTFTDNGNGTGLISGTPTPQAAGSYTVNLYATNDEGTAVKPVILNIKGAPIITSPSEAWGYEGQPMGFQVTASGLPAPRFSKTGKLPLGLIWDATTGTISGTPAAGSAGVYPITIKVKNPYGVAVQNLTLSIGANAPQ